MYKFLKMWFTFLWISCDLWKYLMIGFLRTKVSLPIYCSLPSSCLVFYFSPLIICFALVCRYKCISSDFSTKPVAVYCNNNKSNENIKHNNKSSIEQHCSCSEWHSFTALPPFIAWRLIHKPPSAPSLHDSLKAGIIIHCIISKQQSFVSLI